MTSEIDDVPEATKICKYCEEVKGLSEFYFSEGRLTYSPKCNVCRKKYMQQYKQLFTSKYASLVKVSLKDNKPLDITKEQYIEFMNNNPNCYYCNDLFGCQSLGGYQLDRLDNSKGYSLDNVVRCCGTCNRYRFNNFSSEEYKHIANYLLRVRGLLLKLKTQRFQ